MIDPRGIGMMALNDTVVDVLHLNIIPEYTENIYDLSDEKSYNKFISDVEKEVRGSFEYKRLINYLKKYCGMNQCAYFENTTMNPDSKVTIEIHHHPFTLYDICTIVMAKRMYYNESLELEMVAKEVIKLHYEDKVGLIPLSKTPHKLYHNGFLQIPLESVRGNWRAFKNEYWDFMTNEQKDVIERIIQFNGDYDAKTANKVLEQKNIYLQSELDEYKLPDLHPVIDRITQRISDIKANHYQLPIADNTDYERQIKLLEEKAKAEEARQLNMINPIIEYPEELTEEDIKAIIGGMI